MGGISLHLQPEETGGTLQDDGSPGVPGDQYCTPVHTPMVPPLNYDWALHSMHHKSYCTLWQANAKKIFYFNPWYICNGSLGNADVFTMCREMYLGKYFYVQNAQP